PRSVCRDARSRDPRTNPTALMARLDSTPLRFGGRQLTRTLAMTGLLVTLYDQSLWRYLDQALTAADSGDGRILLLLADAYNHRNADGTYSNLFNGAFHSTNCLDFPVPTDLTAYHDLGPALAKASPLCRPWPQPSTP